MLVRLQMERQQLPDLLQLQLEIDPFIPIKLPILFAVPRSYSRQDQLQLVPMPPG